MIKTWPKTETAHEKSLAPSVRMGRLCTGYMYEEYTTPEQYLALLPIIKRRIQRIKSEIHNLVFVNGKSLKKQRFPFPKHLGWNESATKWTRISSYFNLNFHQNAYHSWTSLQRPPRGQTKAGIVERWPLHCRKVETRVNVWTVRQKKWPLWRGGR